MKSIRNIFICLVHENQDCIIDLVRNLRFLDPKSKIILYNGGTDIDLFKHFPFEKLGVFIYPNPKPLKWGWLHDFAIDCMEYAISKFEFELLTVVDSDQLACGNNYSDFIAATFYNNPNLGMLGQVNTRINANTTIDPAITAYKEEALWRPFLESLPNGKDAFLYWTFWPSTVFSYNAAADLVQLFRTNGQLQDILKQTKIWASEEIILPTLTIALGYTIVENPCSYDFVKYKSPYNSEDISKAIKSENCFWIHPISRSIQDNNRKAIRNYFQDYVSLSKKELREKLLMKKIQEEVATIEGWLLQDEVELLASQCLKVVREKEQAVFVEIGSYCGKSTAVMSLVANNSNSKTKIIAIDDFSGRLGSEDTKIVQYPSCYDKFKKNIERLDVSQKVQVIKEKACEVVFDDEIDVLLIDGLHDYANVARDFYNLESNLKQEAVVFFHDYCSDFLGVVSFVDELIATGMYEKESLSSTLILLKRINTNIHKKQNLNSKGESFNQMQLQEFPLVSCIMPTYNRQCFIPNAITQFLKQDYPNKELIIIDDSDVSIKPLIPDSNMIQYHYLNEKLDIGSKRNIANQMSKGQIIIHLDDDDFYDTNWIAIQVSFLLENQLEITGLSLPLFYDNAASVMWQYTYPNSERPWIYGATLCYTKQLWELNPFPTMNIGEDNAFVWSSVVKKILPHNNRTSYVGQIHQGNTSIKKVNDRRWHMLTTEEALPILHSLNLDFFTKSTYEENQLVNN